MQRLGCYESKNGSDLSGKVIPKTIKFNGSHYRKHGTLKHKIHRLVLFSGNTIGRNVKQSYILDRKYSAILYQ